MTWGEIEPEKRRPAPLHVKLACALRQLVAAWRALGLVGPDEVVELQFDHTKALGLRDVDPDTRQHIPHQHDPEWLEWMIRRDHDIKTRGTGATTNGTDIGEMRKTRQLVKKRKAREARAAAVEAGEPLPPPSRKRPKAVIRSRGFDKGHRPMNGGRKFPKKGDRK